MDVCFTAGADVNAKSKQHGNTPLILAAGRLHKHVTERLLLAGANVNMPSKVSTAALGVLLQDCGSGLEIRLTALILHSLGTRR